MKLLLFTAILIVPVSISFANGNESVGELCNAFNENVMQSDAREFENSVTVKVFNRKLSIPDGFVLNEYKDSYALFLRHLDSAPGGSIRIGEFEDNKSISRYLESHADMACNVRDSDFHITLEKDYFGESQNVVYTVRIFDDKEFVIVISGSLELWSEFVSLQSKRKAD